MPNSNTVHREWASRPSDQRYTSLASMRVDIAARTERATERHVDLAGGFAAGAFYLAPPENSDGRLAIHSEETGREYELSHHAFGHLCHRASAPSAFLSRLPASLAGEALTVALKQRCTPLVAEEVPPGAHASGDLLLLDKWPDNALSVRGITSQRYGRIWDLDVLDLVMQRLDPAVWGVPGAGVNGETSKRATTLYASGHDMFLFLTNERNLIEIPGRPGAPLKRGLIVANSEAGDGTKLRFDTFLYDCC